jgi:hypothetical protein
MKILLILFILSFVSIANAQVLIIGLDIPGLHQKDGNGDYDKIINQKLVKSGKATLKVLPPARAESNFMKCNNCCFSPANQNPEFYDFGKEYIQTKPMGIAKIYIWTKRGSKAIDNLNDLKGKKVGIRHGMPYGKTFDSLGLKTEPVKTIKSNILKLEKGRLDAFIAYVPDAYTIFDELGMDPLPHAKNKPMAVHEDSLVCKGVSDQFVQGFNNSLK